MSNKCALKKSKFYNEPYYPPGYCGYSPQFPFQYGETYGNTTHRLLTDASVAKSKRLVLADIFPKCKDQKKEEDKNRWKRYRNQSWGDKKLIDEMVPGYTGYIPKAEYFFGERYKQVCDDAILAFSKDRQIYSDKKNKIISMPPRVPIRPEPKPYVSVHQIQHSISPYFMNTNDPNKTFVSGYTGFIPRARRRFAQDYAKLTQEALKDFTKHQQDMKALQKKPVIVNRPPIKPAPMEQPVYLNNGLLPRYTGYLPGHKFRYGLTFGASSRYFHAENNNRDKLTTVY